MNRVETDLGERSAPSTGLSRRTVLAAIVAGLASTACRGGEEDLSLSNPSPDGGTVAGGDAITETGPDLVQVDLPTRGDVAPPVVGDGKAPTAAGSGSGGSKATASGNPSPPTTTKAGAASTAGATPKPETPTTASPPTTAAAAAAPSTSAAPAPTAPAAPSTPSTTSFSSPVALGSDAGLLHVANRVTFGVTPDVINQINGLGTGGFVEDQLARTGLDPAAEGRLGQFQLLGLNRKQAYDRLRTDEGRKRFGVEMTMSNVLRATYSTNQLYEMMVQLWMDHFNVNLFGNGKYRHLMIDYQENVIRPKAMGTFRDLLQATAESPAMMVYLNNFESNANTDNGINENYGRELLELHTLGIDENGNQVYSEADVRASAMAMTGWSVVTGNRQATFSDFQFRDNFQHTGEISLLNGAWTKGATTGKATGDSLLDFLATHPSTARYIALKLARRFVSDTPPATLLDSTAEVYLANDTAIVPTLRHVLASAEFAASESQKMRRPFEATVAMLRALNANVPNNPTGKSASRIRNALTAQNNLPWGWEPPDGYPEEAGHWLTTNGLLTRWNLGGRLARNVLNGQKDDDRIQVDYNAIRPASTNVAEFITNLGRQFGLGNLSAQAVTAIAASARLDPAAQPQSMDNEQLGDIAGLLFTHPLFQTR